MSNKPMHPPATKIGLRVYFAANKPIMKTIAYQMLNLVSRPELDSEAFVKNMSVFGDVGFFIRLSDFVDAAEENHT